VSIGRHCLKVFAFLLATVGFEALYSNNTGYYNTTNGAKALYSNTNANTFSDANCNSDGNCYCNSNVYCESNSDGNVYAYCDIYSYSHSEAKAEPHAESLAHARAAPVVCRTEMNKGGTRSPTALGTFSALAAGFNPASSEKPLHLRLCRLPTFLPNSFH